MSESKAKRKAAKVNSDELTERKAKRASTPVENYRGIEFIPDDGILLMRLGPLLINDRLDDTSMLWGNGSLSDMEIVSKERSWKCHRAILYIKSGFFRTMFQAQWKEPGEGKTDLSQEEPYFLEQALKFMYTGRFDLSTAEAPLASLLHLYKLADFLAIESLIHLIPGALGIVYHAFYKKANLTYQVTCSHVDFSFTFSYKEKKEEGSTTDQCQFKLVPRCKNCRHEGNKEGPHTPGRCLMAMLFQLDFAKALDVLCKLQESKSGPRLKRLMARIAVQVWRRNQEYGIPMPNFEGWVKALNDVAKDLDFAEITAGMGTEDRKSCDHLCALEEGKWRSI
ncbi:hypothetical protein MKZ38_009519 [Zalerion maritima]|uniref:BTB domain-containing protein n=1 Tax=Zalerion maritima TaxID=339359 RepID=A0AAD5S1K2_9PEZI|nr:hypothetical protein MKZ38_009519 [Zalerion maritima]